MMRVYPCLAVLVLLLAGPAGAAIAADPPQPVSPGSLSDMAPAASRCPTFTWTTTAGATGYEVAVYPAEDREAAGTPPGAPGGPVLHESLPAGAGSWTPPADACLETGVDYAWSVRAETDRGLTDWSLPALFLVAPWPDDPETEFLVRRVLERLEDGAATGRQEREREEAEAVRRHRLEVARRAGSPVNVQLTAPERDGAAPGEAASERVEVAADEPVQLAVDGAVQAPRFVFDSPRSVEVVVGAASFRVADTAEDDHWALDPAGYAFVPSIPDSVARVDLAAPVHGLPARGTIDLFKCQFRQLNAGSTATLTFVLRRRGTAESSSTVVADVSGTTFNTGGFVGGFSANVDDHDLQTDGAAYFITGTWDPSAVGSDLGFYGCSIFLETDEL